MRLLSVSDAAEACDLSVDEILDLIRDGDLPAERVGGQWVIRDSDLADADDDEQNPCDDDEDED